MPTTCAQNFQYAAQLGPTFPTNVCGIVMNDKWRYLTTFYLLGFGDSVLLPTNLCHSFSSIKPRPTKAFSDGSPCVVFQSNGPIALPVTDACLNEAMRIKPVGPVVIRRALDAGSDSQYRAGQDKSGDFPLKTHCSDSIILIGWFSSFTSLHNLCTADPELRLAAGDNVIISLEEMHNTESRWASYTLYICTFPAILIC